MPREPKYVVEAGDRKSKPTTLAEIQKRFAAGKIPKNAKVRAFGSGSAIPVRVFLKQHGPKKRTRQSREAPASNDEPTNIWRPPESVELAVGAAKVLIEKFGVPALYATGAEVYRQAKDFDAGGLPLHQYAERPVLVLSDPINASGGVSEFEADVLYQIFDARYRNALPSIVCVNATGADDLDKRIGKRQADRLLHGAAVVVMNWPSYRRVA